MRPQPIRPILDYLYTVRMPSTLFIQITRAARRAGVGESEFMRRAAESALAKPKPGGAECVAK